MGNSESEELISTASGKLKRSSVHSYDENKSIEVDESRLSKQAWLTEEMSEAAKRITSRLDGFLDVEATSDQHSERYQVANYGLAGQYICHTDAILMFNDTVAKKELKDHRMIYLGDRAATVCIDTYFKTIPNN